MSKYPHIILQIFKSTGAKRGRGISESGIEKTNIDFFFKPDFLFMYCVDIYFGISFYIFKATLLSRQKEEDILHSCAAEVVYKLNECSVLSNCTTGEPLRRKFQK